MKKTIHRTALPLLTAALALALGGCIEDENVLVPDQTPAQRLFMRYVALGNSLTAGWMSGGINDSTQRLAYPVLLAEMAEADFGVPSLAMPGCPPPLVGVVDTDLGGNVILEEDRVAGGSATQCGLRSYPPPPVVQNLAVPGAKVADAIDIDRAGNASNPLTTLINGGLSQVEAMRRVRPTLVTSWLGNNDVLGAALAGDTTLLTPLDSFTTYHQRVAQGIAGSGTTGAALIGVIDVTLTPVLQPGLYYWLADSLGYAPKPADESCAPTDSAGVLNPLSMNTVSWSVYRDDDVAVVSCDPAAPYVLTPAERVAISDRADDFNDVIQGEANNRDWVYLDATNLLESRLSQAGSAQHNLLRRCVGLSNTQTEANMAVFFEARCPNPSAPNYFGSLVTFDGIHMSAAAHAIVADELAEDLDARYDIDF